MSQKSKGKKRLESQVSREGKQSRSHSPKQCGIDFTEAAGKTVSLRHYRDDGLDWQGLEVSFTDGTMFPFELLPQVLLHAQYLESRRGDLQRIRSYAMLPDKNREKREE